MSAEFHDGFTITVLAPPRGPSALVCLSGEIDMAASVALSHAANRLSTVAPAIVIVDLANVTFACSTLPNFVVHLHQCLPVSSTLLLCRPITSIRQLLQMTGMGEISVVRAHLPCQPQTTRRRARPSSGSLLRSLDRRVKSWRDSGHATNP